MSQSAVVFLFSNRLNSPRLSSWHVVVA